jgi:hypothetical protein
MDLLSTPRRDAASSSRLFATSETVNFADEDIPGATYGWIINGYTMVLLTKPKFGMLAIESSPS